MLLYHFCADGHIKKIRREGLTIGGVAEPTKTGYYLHGGWIWLTEEQDARMQSWATGLIVPYSRVAWRITIEIPENETERIYDRKRLCALYPNCNSLFEGWRGSERWRAFRGHIPKEWFCECVKTGQ